MLREHIPESVKQAIRLLRSRFLSIGLRQSEMFVQSESELEASGYMSVVVAIHDSPDVTRRCLASLERYGGNAEIILIDDCSQLEETINLINEYGERNKWITIRHDKAMGHSRVCEAGCSLATRPYLCLLNSDTVITPWSWRASKQAFESDPMVAVTGPSTSWAATPQIIQRASYCRLYWSDSQINAFAKKYIELQEEPLWEDLSRISGFAFFVRRTLWQSYGGFDSNLPDYGNESELCARILRDGHRLVWTKNSYIHHFGQGTYVKLIGKKALSERRMAAQKYIDSKRV